MPRSKRVPNLLLGVSLVALCGLSYVLLAEGSAPSPEPAAEHELAQVERPEQPDLIFITIDTLRADGLGVYGNEHATTPVMDALAGEGITFLNSVTAFPRTTPGMGSLFTGLWPHHHGSREVWEQLREGTMLTELLHERGYQTIGLTSNSACGHKQGFERGFDSFVRRKEFKTISAGEVTDKALELLAKADPDEPLFLWVHYTDPHWSYLTPGSSKRQPAAPGCRQLLARRIGGRELSLGEIQGNLHGLSSRYVDECRSMYDSTITYADREIGRLIEGLGKAGRWDDALMVLTADHGENMGEDGYYYAHGPSLAEGSLRVPLIIKGPGVPEGQLDEGVACGIDVMPTILDLLGVPAEDRPEMDGRSLSWRWDPDQALPKHLIDYAYAESATEFHTDNAGFIASGRPGKRYCVHDLRYSMCVEAEGAAQLFYDRKRDPKLEQALEPERLGEDERARLEQAYEAWPQGSARQRTIRTRRWKLVERPRLEGGYELSLYDLRTDPEATQDLLAEELTRGRKLGELLHRWLADQPVYEAEERSSEALRELRALGYIGD